MKVAAYIRVSTTTQDDSPEVQYGLIREFCMRQVPPWEPVAAYVDEDVSRCTEIETRPAFRELLAQRKTLNFNTIVILKIDRFSSNIFDFIAFERAAVKNKLTVAYATETYDESPTGRLMKYMKVLMAEHERASTGERILQHNRHLAATGRWPAGRPPLGMIYDLQTKTILPSDRADDAIAVFRAYIAANGNKSQTAAKLNAMGILTRDNGLWSDDAVARVVSNPTYRGRLHYADVDMESDSVPRIIPREILEEADILLENTQNKFARSSPKVVTYSSILHCAYCGSNYKLNVRHAGGWETYACRGKKERGVCSGSSVSSRWLDVAVPEGLQIALQSEADRYAEALKQGGEQDAKVQADTRRIASLQDAKKKVKELFVAGLIETVDEVKARVAELDAQIAEFSTKPRFVPLSGVDMGLLAGNIRELWGAMSIDDRRKILLTCCPDIYLWSDPGKKRIQLHTKLPIGVIDIPQADIP